MPTNRVALNRRHTPRINAAAVAAYRRGREILAAGDGEAWEPAGRRRELLEAERDIRMALQMPPWSVSPLDPGLDGEMPAYMQASNLCSASTWEPARQLRASLEAALKAEEKGR